MDQRSALLSVFDKTNITDLANAFVTANIQILTTGGTAKALKAAKIPYTEVSDYTGFPEMLDGRVKTLHPKVHAGILAQRNKKDHTTTLAKHQISPIDFVVCNLYPFEATIAKPNVTMEEVIENIDIGGPSMIRAAAKNYPDVVILTSPSQYPDIITALQHNKPIGIQQRQQYAIAAYNHTAQYDTLITTYLRHQWHPDPYPTDLTLTMRKKQDMRYGENPHQKACFYQTLPPTTEPCITTATQLHGKELSFNNILDSNYAIEALKEFSDTTCVIVKHATPCGIATAQTPLQAWKDAYATDIYSPFGGIVALNRTLDQPTAQEIAQYFLEVIIAPDYTDDALTILNQKKNLRLLKLPGLDTPIPRQGTEYRSVVGGMLAQDRDTHFADPKTWKTVTHKKPTPTQIHSMIFAAKAVKHIKSNSVVFVKNTQTIAIGGGQTSRVDAVWIATHKGADNIKNSTMASDAYFPFRDGVDVAAQAGVAAILQPGGSIRDDEVITAANEHGIPMVFTGQRYFRH
jgi:phosphoribosylaminoimidazolecarboxamide formyltransferase / IMP cyclohydrolase